MLVTLGFGGWYNPSCFMAYTFAIPNLPLIRLVIAGAAGALTFVAAVSGSWIVSGRPSSSEGFVREGVAAFLYVGRVWPLLASSLGEGRSDA